MKGITYQGIRKVSYEEVEDPTLIDPGDAIIKLKLGAICGSDLHVYNGREVGIDPGTVMGHEFMGEVVETGKEVRNFSSGETVISPFFSCCGSCFYCQNDLSCRCSKGELFGWVENGVGLQGTQAEYIRVPMADSTLTLKPEDLTDLEGLLLGDILPTAFFCVDMASPKPGGTYAVIGCGPVGLLIIATLIEKGVKAVFAFDLEPERLVRAELLGAEGVLAGKEDTAFSLLEATDGRGAEAVLEAVGNRSSQELAYQLVRKGGRISVVGVHNEPEFSFAPVDLYNKNLSYSTGRCPVQKFVPELVDFIRKGSFDVSSIISHTLPLSLGEMAYSMFNDKSDGCTKVVLHPD